MEEVKPPVTTVTRKSFGEEEKEQPVTIGNIAIIAVIVALSTPVMLLVGHALPLLDSFFNGMKPLVSYLGFCTGVALFVLVGLLLWYVHDRLRVDVRRRIIEAGKFQVDPQSGNYDAYLDEKKQFLVPRPGVTVTPVPQTFAPQLHFINKGNMTKGEIAAEPALLEQGNVQRPSVDELVSKIERNSLQVNLGRCLTNSQDLIADITTSHIKVIGITQMGKSCGIAAILTQVEQTHDPERLRFAILDLEDKTGKILEHSDHVAVLDIGRGRQGRIHAKSIDEVPVYLGYIVDELERRYRLAPDELARLPHILVYIEEFLDLKNRLKNKGGKVCDQFITDFTTLATRGLKAGLHIIASTQLDYADEDLREAMSQFSTLIAFRVKPTAAQSAGFMRHDLIKQNFINSTPGQFVVEMIGLADIGIAPEYDVKAKLKALHETRVLNMSRKTVVLDDETLLKHSGNEERNVLDPALRAKLHQVMDIPGENMRDCIKRVWGADPGGNERYRQAKGEYEEVLKVIHQLARKGMEV